MGMASRCQRRQLAITAGNRVGLVLEKAWPGDLIAVSNGRGMPFILCADIRCRFRLVGDLLRPWDNVWRSCGGSYPTFTEWGTDLSVRRTDTDVR
jgi:hypothetical protein